jgi:hypothetical protein
MKITMHEFIIMMDSLGNGLQTRSDGRTLYDGCYHKDDRLKVWKDLHFRLKKLRISKVGKLMEEDSNDTSEERTREEE